MQTPSRAQVSREVRHLWSCLLSQGFAHWKECATRDSGQALLTLVPVVFSFFTTPFTIRIPWDGVGLG